MESEKPKSSNVPLYAQGTFDRELNYKLWSTYKGRFNASARYERKHRLSARAVALLSAYVTIFSVITVVLGRLFGDYEVDVIVITSVSLSILILVFGILESSENFMLKADRYHRSGLEIAELYKELRSLKTKFPEKDGKFNDEVDKLRGKYDDILRRSDNHDDIDHQVFMANKPDYEDHKLGPNDVSSVKRKLFVRHFLPYYIAMVLPPVFFFAFVTIVSVNAHCLSG